MLKKTDSIFDKKAKKSESKDDSPSIKPMRQHEVPEGYTYIMLIPKSNAFVVNRIHDRPIPNDAWFLANKPQIQHLMSFRVTHDLVILPQGMHPSDIPVEEPK